MPAAESCDEATSLLQEPPESASHSDSVDRDSANPGWIVIVVLLCSGAVLFDLSNNMGAAAEVAIMEDIVCKAYYANSARHNTILGMGERCKIEPIQTEIAFLNGWRETFETIPAITLALPYGMLADWIGYRPVALLAFFGTVMCANWSRVVFWFYPILPIRTLWFSALWRILGGGPQIVTSLTFSAVASVTPAEKRMTVFSQMTAVILTAELIGPPVGAMLMAKNPWIPFLTSSAVAAISFIWAVFFFPNIQNQIKSSSPYREQQFVHNWRVSENFHRICGELWRNRNAALVVVCFFVSLLGTHTFGLLLQYVTKRFHVSYAEASYAYSLRASFSLISLFILLPVATNLLDRKYAWEVTRRDKVLTQVNALFMLLGCILIFVAPNLIFLSFGVVMFGLGSSFSVTARTLLTSLVDQSFLSTAYTFLSIMSSIESLVSGPMLAAVYHMGMVLGDMWLGLPFLFAAALYGISLIVVSAVKIPRTA